MSCSIDDDVDTPTATPATSKKWGYITLVGGSLLQLTVGSQLTWGNLVPYFASYFASNINSAEGALQLTPAQMIPIYGKATAQANWIYVVSNVAMACCVYLGGSLEIKLGTTKTLAIASALISFGYASTYFALVFGGQYAFYITMVTLGLFWGSGIGLAYPVLTMVAMRWFPDNRGFVSGLCSGIYGSGSFVFDSIQTALINPLNIAYSVPLGYTQQPQILARLPLMLIYVAVVFSCMQIISLLCIRNPLWYTSDATTTTKSNHHSNNNVGTAAMEGPPMPGNNNTTATNNRAQAVQKSAAQLKYERFSLTVAETLRFRAFWELFILTTAYLIVCAMLILQWKVLAINYLQITNDRFLGLIGSLASLCNGFGRVLWGVVYDWTGNSFRLTLGTMSATMTVLVTTLPLCQYAPYVMFPIWNCLMWMNINCNFAVLPSVISRVFGTKHCGGIFGLFLLPEAIGIFVIASFAPAIQSLFQGWTDYILAIAACAAFSTLLAMLYKPRINRKKYLLGSQASSEDDGASEERPMTMSMSSGYGSMLDTGMAKYDGAINHITTSAITAFDDSDSDSESAEDVLN